VENFDRENVDELIKIRQIRQYFPPSKFCAIRYSNNFAGKINASLCSTNNWKPLLKLTSGKRISMFILKFYVLLNALLPVHMHGLCSTAENQVTNVVQGKHQVLYFHANRKMVVL